MTLNITILTQKFIFQSADYRLSISGKPIATPSTKVLEITYNGWAGSITYTGVGRYGSRDFSLTLTSWLKGIDTSATFDDVANTIRKKAALWFRIFNPPQRHTIIIAAFSEGRSRAVLISNYEDLNGKTSYPKNAFEVYKIPKKQSPKLY